MTMEILKVSGICQKKIKFQKTSWNYFKTPKNSRELPNKNLKLTKILGNDFENTKNSWELSKNIKFPKTPGRTIKIPKICRNCQIKSNSKKFRKLL